MEPLLVLNYQVTTVAVRIVRLAPSYMRPLPCLRRSITGFLADTRCCRFPWSTSLRVVRCPESFQPVRNGGVLTQIVAWRIALDIENRGTGPGVDAADPKGAARAAEQPWCADAERIRTARGTSRKQSHLRQPCAPLWHVSARLPRPAGAVEPDDDEKVAILLDTSERVLPARQDIECG